VPRRFVAGGSCVAQRRGYWTQLAWLIYPLIGSLLKSRKRQPTKGRQPAFDAAHRVAEASNALPSIGCTNPATERRDYSWARVRG
jgi:hypothetical protein